MSDYDRAVFPKRLRALRLESVGSQDRLAQRTGLSKGSIQNWEGSSGRPPRLPSADNLILLADLFGTSIDYLLGRTDDRRAFRPSRVNGGEPRDPVGRVATPARRRPSGGGDALEGLLADERERPERVA